MNQFHRRCWTAGFARWAKAFVLTLVAVALLSGSGCSFLRHEAVTTKSMLGSLTGGAGQAGATNLLEVVQAGVMREADLYVGTVAQATDDFRQKVPTTEARNLAQQWKLMEATAA